MDEKKDEGSEVSGRKPRSLGEISDLMRAGQEQPHRSLYEKGKLYESMSPAQQNGLIVSPGGSKAEGEWLVALAAMITDSKRPLEYPPVHGLFLDAQAAPDSGAADAIAEHASSVLKELNGIKSLFTVGVLNYPIGRSDPSKIAATIAEVARALESKTSSVINYRRLFWGFRFSADPEVAETPRRSYAGADELTDLPSLKARERWRGRLVRILADPS